MHLAGQARPMSRRQFVAAVAGLAAVRDTARFPLSPPLSSVTVQRPRPTPSQLVWQQDELALFLHFGVNTFTDREWGDGREDPAVFAPARLDGREWARAAQASGFRAMILTAKHHDGFC